MQASSGMGVALVAATLAIASAWTDSSAQPAATPVHVVPAPHVYPAPGPISIALTGDSIIAQALSPHRDPAFTRLIELIRGADAAFTNLEMLFHDYEPYPSAESGGTYMRADPALAKELRWAGFDLLALANNHTGDYGVLGAQLTAQYVREADLVGAGFGNSLREAREARYLETDRGRIALVSVSSTFPDESRASDSWGDSKARPGLAPLRYRTTHVLERVEFDALRQAFRNARVPFGPVWSPVPVPQTDTEMNVLGRRFVVGPRNGVRTEPLEEDLQAMTAVVSNASRQADYVIVAAHSHENAGDREVPPEFFVTFAHQMIDAGADMIVTTGPHILRGIEIYRNRPILYGLGDFIFQNETLLRQPPENYEAYALPRESGVGDFNDIRTKNGTSGFPADRLVYESMVAIPVFNGDRLTELKLHPVSLGFGQPRSRRGRPVLADPALAQKIIADVARLSAPYGTQVEFRKGVGIVVIPE